MTNKNNSLAKMAGIVLILFGLLSNEWVLRYFFSPDGQLVPLTRILIWSFDLLIITSGLILLIVKSFLKLAIVYASLFISFLLTELALSNYMDLSKDFFMSSPQGTGSYRLKPNIDFRRRIGTSSYLFHTNSHGMPWKEVNQENSTGKTRIAFVGDSFTFGCCANRVEDSFVGTVDRKMGSKYEVLNFGVVGYGLADEKLIIEEEVLLFRPSYIALMFFNGNDFSDTFLSISTTGKLLGYLERSPEGRPGIPWYTPIQRRAQPITRTATFRLLDQLLVAKQDPREFRDPNNFESPIFWSKKSYPDIGVKARDFTLHFLGEIVQLCNRNNVQLVVVTIPYLNQVYASEMTTGDFDFRSPQKYVEEFSRRHSIAYFDLLPALRQYVQNSGREIYLRGDGHFNDHGHKLVGDLLVKYFTQVLTQKPS